MEQAIWKTLVIVLVAGVALEALILIAIMRQLGGIILQLRPARLGEVEHDEGPEVGLEVNIPGLLEGRAAIILFLSTECRICTPLLPAIRVVARRYQDLEVLTIVAGDDDEERDRFARESGVQSRSDLLGLDRDWNIPGTPFAVAIDREGRVHARGVANSLDQLESLAESLTRGREDALETDTADRSGEEGIKRELLELVPGSRDGKVGEAP